MIRICFTGLILCSGKGNFGFIIPEEDCGGRIRREGKHFSLLFYFFNLFIRSSFGLAINVYAICF